jgi:phenylacetate-CoA ligase
MSFVEPSTFKALQLASAYNVFRSKYKLLQKSQWWSKAQLEEYQLRQLNELLTHAYNNVPYYSKVFNERGLTPRDIRDFGDLEKLPFLTKEIVRNNIDVFRARNYAPSKFEYVTTGGSSGTPLGFYYERRISRAKEWAFIRTLWGRVGYNFSKKCVVLRGDVVETADKGIYWKSAIFGRWLILPSYHISEITTPTYVARIRKFEPEFVWAYPSTITLLAHFMKKLEITPFTTLKAILCGSESVYPSQRDLLEQVFGCRVFSWYGHSEMGALAGECEESADYHLFPEYGFVELINTDGTKVENAAERGEIVTTGFNNPIFPLIRYRTGDFAVYSDHDCACARAYDRLGSIEGRWLQEMIVGTNGRLFPLTALNMHSDVYDNVEQFQFRQHQAGELILCIVKGKHYAATDSQKLQQELTKKIGDDMRLEIQFVDHLHRTATGKFKFLVQELPVDQLNGYFYESMQR